MYFVGIKQYVTCQKLVTIFMIFTENYLIVFHFWVNKQLILDCLSVLMFGRAGLTEWTCFDGFQYVSFSWLHLNKKVINANITMEFDCLFLNV